MRTSFDDVFQPVDHTSSIPLYLQIVFQMDSALRAGRLPQDTLLPSEPELCAGFDVSRSTLRRAMGKLEDRGIVTRERGRGKGTRIVSTAPITRTPGSFTTMFNQIAAARRRPRTRVLTFERLVVDEALANLTGFPVNTSIVHVLRHRSANDVPVAVLENWILSDYISFTRCVSRTRAWMCCSARVEPGSTMPSSSSSPPSRASTASSSVSILRLR